MATRLRARSLNRRVAPASSGRTQMAQMARNLKRRDLYRLSFGMALSPLLAKSALAQMSVEAGTTPASSEKPQTIVTNSPRSYNHVNQPRKYVAGRKRFSIYWTWSYPWEANRDVAELDNRFSTMTKVR